MTQRRGGGHGRGTDKVHFVECPGCGCPNRPQDQKCMYCRTELHGPTAALKGHLYPYLNNIRNIFTFQPPLSEAKGIARSLLAFILSIAFIGIGMTFVIRGLNEGGYFNWTIGALLLFYGGAALRNAWIAFFRK